MSKNDSLGRGALLRRTPLKRSAVGLHPKRGGEKPVSAKETAKSEKRRRKVDLAKRLDMVFSLYIRLRDAMPGGMTRCISCGRVLPFERMQCGHFYSRKNMATRWDEDNCHAECALDNCFNEDHLTGYRANLLAKIGEERLERLGERSRSVRKWSDEELSAMIEHYAAEARRLGREKGIET